jgi:hypothetical protein
MYLNLLGRDDQLDIQFNIIEIVIQSKWIDQQFHQVFSLFHLREKCSNKIEQMNLE